MPETPWMSEVAPLPPGVSPATVKRVLIQRADGTVQVIEYGNARGR
jgi:hypothetical protein